MRISENFNNMISKLRCAGGRFLSLFECDFSLANWMVARY